MKTLLTLSLLWLAGDPYATVAVLRARYAYAHVTRPALPDSLARGAGAFELEMNPAAVARAVTRPRRDLIVYSQPFHQCPPCQALYNAVGEGDADLRLTWVKSNLPRWVTATPTVYDPVTNQYRVGVQSLEQLRAWTGVKPTAADPPVMGTIRNGAALDEALEAVRKSLGDANVCRLDHGGTIPCGQLTVVLPSPTVLRWDLASATKRLTFEGGKPLLRAWGTQVKCDGVTYDGRTVSLEIPRFPDWSLRVVKEATE